MIFFQIFFITASLQKFLKCCSITVQIFLFPKQIIGENSISTINRDSLYSVVDPVILFVCLPSICSIFNWIPKEIWGLNVINRWNRTLLRNLELSYKVNTYQLLKDQALHRTVDWNQKKNLKNMQFRGRNIHSLIRPGILTQSV